MKILQYIILLFFTYSVCAQNTEAIFNRKIDSLNIIFKNEKPDTSRCRILYNMAEEEEEATIKAKYNEQLRNFVEQKLKLAVLDKTLSHFYLKYLGKSINNIGSYATDQSDYEKALKFYQYGLKIGEKNRDKAQISSSYLLIGLFYCKKGDHKRALDYFEIGLCLSEEIKNKQEISVIYNGMAYVYEAQGKISQALKYYQKSLKISEEIGDQINAAVALNNISLIYLNQGDQTMALVYCYKSLKKTEVADSKSLTTTSKRLMATVFNNIGGIYFDQKNLLKSLEYHAKSLSIQENIRDEYGAAFSHINIGSINAEKNDFFEALIHLKKSLNYFEKIDNKIGIAMSLYHIGKIYKKQKKYNKALESGLKSLKLSKDGNYVKGIENVAQLLCNVYVEIGSYDKALDSYKLFVVMRDSINNIETQKATVKSQLKYEYAQKAISDSVRNAGIVLQEKIKYEETIKRERVYTYFSICAAIFMLVIASLTFIMFKTKQRANKIINEQKKVIEQQKIEVEQQLLLTQMNPHFIFNAVSTLKGLIFKKETEEASLYLDHFTALTRQILEYSEKKFITLNHESEVLGNYIALQKIMYCSTFDYELIIDEQIDQKKIMVPPMLAQPFVENAIKHGIVNKKDQGLIQVSFIKKGTQLFLSIDDNGSGIDYEKINNHQSMSLSIVKRRLGIYNHQFNNEISIENKLDDAGKIIGARVYFEIPYTINSNIDFEND